jgi:hypothetical protein
MDGQVKHWTASRKIEVVLRLLRGESLGALSRKLGIEIYVEGSAVKWSYHQ